MGKELVPRRVLEAFVDCFGGMYLREVDALFTDLGFGFDEAAEGRASQSGRGQHRILANGAAARQAYDRSWPSDALDLRARRAPIPG